MSQYRLKEVRDIVWLKLGIGDVMRFTDYIIDRLLYILFYFISIILVIIIMSLDSINNNKVLNIGTILYSIIISIAMLLIFFAIDYLRKKEVYIVINRGLEGGEFNYIFNLPDRVNREHKVFKELLTKNHMYYENTLDKYRKRYKGSLNLKSRWIHQLKTSISVIKLLLEKEKEKIIDENTRRSYESIEEELEKLSHGLEMELYSLRINDFEMDFKVEKIDLVDIVREVVNENKNAFIVNSIYPNLKSEGDIYVKSDKKWLKFIISQIISNSIKYTKVRDVEKKYIHVSLSKEEERTVLSIEDNGVGIPKKDLARVFNAFFTGDNGRKYYESTGMGLYLVKEICNKLGHGVELRSEEDVGTIVKIIFYDTRSIYDKIVS